MAFYGSVTVALTYAATFPDRVSHLILVVSSTNMSDLAVTPSMETNDALIDKDLTLYTETLAHVLIGFDDPPTLTGLGD